jgi:hypothetical protein
MYGLIHRVWAGSDVSHRRRSVGLLCSAERLRETGYLVVQLQQGRHLEKLDADLLCKCNNAATLSQAPMRETFLLDQA